MLRSVRMKLFLDQLREDQKQSCVCQGGAAARLGGTELLHDSSGGSCVILRLTGEAVDSSG